MRYQLISGPVSYSRYKIDNKKIFLFGDVHFSKDFQCSKESITIPQLLNNLAKKYDKQKIDLFLEVPYSNIESNNKPSFIKSYIEQLMTKTGIIQVQHYYQKYGCFTKDRKLCEYKFKNMRFHAADFRFSYGCYENTELENFYSLLYVILQIVHEGIDSVDPKIIRRFIEVIKKYDTIDKLHKSILKILQCHKIQVQLNKIDKKYSSKIDKFIKKELLELKNKYKKDYNDGIKSIYNFLNKKPYNSFILEQSISKMIDIYINIDTIVMDIYLLARVFKPYTKNVFIYAGDLHIMRYKRFFENVLKSKPIDLGKQVSYRCIKIKEIAL